MSKAHHNFAGVGSDVYVAAGPTSPNPGPTFPNEAAAPPMAEVKSKPKILSTPAPIINRMRYKIKKARTLYTIGCSRLILLRRTIRIAFG